MDWKGLRPRPKLYWISRLKAACRSCGGRRRPARPSAPDDKKRCQMRWCERPNRFGGDDLAVLEHARRRAVQKDDAREAEHAVKITNRILSRHTRRSRSRATVRAQLETGPGRSVRTGEGRAANVDKTLQGKCICERASDNVPQMSLQDCRHNYCTPPPFAAKLGARSSRSNFNLCPGPRSVSICVVANTAGKEHIAQHAHLCFAVQTPAVVSCAPRGIL